MAMYELLTITKAPLDKKDPSAFLPQIEKTIKKQGGEVKKRNNWGEKEFKYPIKKQTQGEYVLWEIALASDKVQALKNALALQEEVLRAILLRKAVK